MICFLPLDAAEVRRARRSSERAFTLHRSAKRLRRLQPLDRIFVQERLLERDGRTLYAADEVDAGVPWSWRRCSLPALFCPARLVRLRLLVVKLVRSRDGQLRITCRRETA